MAPLRRFQASPRSELVNLTNLRFGDETEWLDWDPLHSTTLMTLEKLLGLDRLPWCLGRPPTALLYPSSESRIMPQTTTL